jgi:hypothetical protein
MQPGRPGTVTPQPSIFSWLYDYVEFWNIPLLTLFGYNVNKIIVN